MGRNSPEKRLPIVTTKDLRTWKARRSLRLPNMEKNNKISHSNLINKANRANNRGFFGKEVFGR